MSFKSCVRDQMEKGASPKQARQFCKTHYESKTTPGVYYRSIVPGVKTTEGRLQYEKLRRKKRPSRRAYKG